MDHTRHTNAARLLRQSRHISKENLRSAVISYLSLQAGPFPLHRPDLTAADLSRI